MGAQYHTPLSLTVISSIVLGIGAICMFVVIVDIILRRGWRSMMGIMIPVWPINATYMGPITLYLYFKYGRATKPGGRSTDGGHPHAMADGMDHLQMDHPQMHHSAHKDHKMTQDHGHMHGKYHSDASPADNTMSGGIEKEQHNMEHGHKSHGAADGGHMNHHMLDPNRPMWVTVLIGVSHCGAGCVLGDIVGEWLVCGTNAKINGQGIWVELLVDYGFALLFGVVFQYFSIAPMSGEYGPKTLVRAAKADVLSLTSFEVGLFGWMLIYQIGIWDYRLDMDNATYWWMMQVGMFLGFWTAIPVNWWLITKNIKEPCA